MLVVMPSLLEAEDSILEVEVDQYVVAVGDQENSLLNHLVKGHSAKYALSMATQLGSATTGSILTFNHKFHLK